MQTGLTRIPAESTPANAPAELVLEVLSDETCRALLTTLQDTRSPMTAQELSAACDVPLSTTYRKLEQLSTTALVDETLQLRASGTHTHQYRPRVESVTIRLCGAEGIELTVTEGC